MIKLLAMAYDQVSANDQCRPPDHDVCTAYKTELSLGLPVFTSTPCSDLLKRTSRTNTRNTNLNQPLPPTRTMSHSVDASESSRIFLHVCTLLTQDYQEPRCPHEIPLDSCQPPISKAYEKQPLPGPCEQHHAHDSCLDCAPVSSRTEETTLTARL